MTAVTLVLSLVEPWTVSLRPRQAHAESMLPPMLSALRQPWQSLELVLVPQLSGKTANLPQAHVIVRLDGHVEMTGLWDAAHPLPNNVLRVCAVYQGQPTDEMLRTWLRVCDDANSHFGADIKGIRLKTLPQATADAAQSRVLGAIQRRINGMLQSH